MKRVWSRFKVRKAPRKRLPPIKRVHGMPKCELTRRLAGMGCSLRDDEDTIKLALRYVEDFLDYVRCQSCAVCGRRGAVDPHHVDTRGSRAGDIGNAVAACRYGCHGKAQDDPGIDLSNHAVALGLAFLDQRPAVKRFLVERQVALKWMGAVS